MLFIACGAEEDSAEVQGDDGETIVIEHELGEATVPKNPENIVVFDFGALDTLDALGVEVTGVPQMNVPTYLEKYGSDPYVNVGGLKEPAFETIAEINPDVIIISARQVEDYQEFTRLGPTVYIELDTDDYMTSFEENVLMLASIFDKEEEATEHLNEIKERVASLREEVSALEEDALILLANDGKVSAYGAGSRFGMIHDDFGFLESDENIEASTHGQSVSFEYIVKQDPDYLFVIDRAAVVGGETSAEQIIENELTRNMKAYENDKIIYLDPNYWYLSSGGLTSVSEMITEIEQAIES